MRPYRTEDLGKKMVKSVMAPSAHRRRERCKELNASLNIVQESVGDCKSI